MIEHMYVVPECVIEKYVTDAYVLEYCRNHKVNPLDLAEYSDTCSVSTAAKMMGYEVFDTALPINWVRKIQQEYGINPVGKVVWCYDTPKTYGYPAPITREGEVLCKILEHIYSR